jgi:hypothetical protein
MPTKREERERMRQERLAAQQAASSSERRRLFIGYGVAGLIVVAIAAGIVVAITGSGSDGGQVDGQDVPDAAHVQLAAGSINDFEFDDREGTPPPALQQGDLQAAAKDGRCELQLDLEDEGATHFGLNAEPPEYGTNPPTSGNHIEPPHQQADGAYAEKVEDKFIVHSLEHGRIALQYSPDLSEAEQLEIKGVFDESPFGVVLFPNPDMPYEVAATGWRQLIGCREYEGAATLDAIRVFRDTYIGQGPEDVPIYLGQ